MKGIPSSELTQKLLFVKDGFETDPFSSLPQLKQSIQVFIEKHFKGSYKNLEDAYEKIPLECYRSFSFDELCKFYYSTNTYLLHKELQGHFETDPSCNLTRKISSSMWRWGLGRGSWNQVAEFYNKLSNFDFGHFKDFEIRIDCTKGVNKQGRSLYSDTYLDGAFGILIYYRSKHVMTIGFSLSENKRILIQQVQLKEKKGNRFLYKLPKNRVEFVIDLFLKNFPGYEIYLVDGTSTSEQILGRYESQRDRIIKFVDSPDLLDEDNKQVYLRLVNEINSLKSDTPRLAALYGNPGRYKISCEELTLNNLRHYKIVA